MAVPVHWMLVIVQQLVAAQYEMVMINAIFIQKIIIFCNLIIDEEYIAFTFPQFPE